MHPLILGATLLATLPAFAAPAALAAGRCPAPQAALHEAFIAADCSNCWAADETGPATGWRFDWIVPVGPDSAMAAAGLTEATERAQRAGRLPGPGSQLLTGRATLPARNAPRLTVVSGPPWHGYFGLEMRLRPDARRPLPAGSSAWLALVEPVAAGSEGTPIARALVRSVAGPLPLNPAADGTVGHLRALRWPDGARPERLQARAWLEGPDGQVLAVAADRCP